MANAIDTRVGRPDRGDGEQRFVVGGVTWKEYVLLRDALDTPGLRMIFCQGVLELMSPSRSHEDDKTTIARLVELFALETGLRLYGYGSTTFRHEARERGAEPDECWTVGGPMDTFPHIVLEVVLTSGGIDKLDVYSGLDVQEVWIYEKGVFHLHELGGDGYRAIAQSALVPGLDFVELADLLALEDQHEAVQIYRDRLRAR